LEYVEYKKKRNKLKKRREKKITTHQTTYIRFLMKTYKMMSYDKKIFLVFFTSFAKKSPSLAWHSKYGWFQNVLR